jgi:hypothetical protein
MPKAKKKLTPAAQSKQFVDTAKALGVDESGKKFEKAFKAIVPKKKSVQP